MDRAADRLGSTPLPDRAERYFQARALLELGMPSQALALLTDLAATAGAFGGPALEAAVDALFAAGQYREVAALAEESRAERFQDENRLQYQLGQSLFLSGEPAKGRPHLEKVATGPYQAYALYTLALVAQGEGRMLDAVETLGRAIEAAASHPDAAVGAALADRIRLTRGRVLYQAAAGLSGLAEGDRRRLFDLAGAQFERIGKQSPFYADALRGSGWCALEKGDSARALAAFEGAAELDPARRHEDLWAQGRSYQRLGFYDEAARFYGEARKAAAGAAGAAFQDETAVPSARWGLLSKGLAVARARTAGLAESLDAVAAAVDGKTARIAASDKRLADLGRRGGAVAAEVGDMSGHLEGYLDAIGAPALFPKAERPRLEAAVARQERVLRDMVTLEAVLERLGSSTTWERAPAGQRRRADVLWRRLETAKAGLSGAQLTFLQGLKGRVSTREEELRRAIEARQADVAGLDGALAGARDRIAREGVQLVGVRRRLQDLAARREALLQKVQLLEGEARRGREEEARRAWEERGRGLLLKADAYTLDETEALQLWEEKGRTRQKGAVP
jgi:hypothetical protein